MRKPFALLALFLAASVLCSCATSPLPNEPIPAKEAGGNGELNETHTGVGETSDADNSAGNGDTSVGNENPAPTSPPDEESQGGPTFPERLPITDASFIESGMYRIGTDLPAGTYVAMNDGSVLSSLSSITVRDGSGADSNILIVDPFSQHTIFEVRDGDYLDIRGAEALDIACSAVLFEMMYAEYGLYCEGMYWVGFHLPAGEYKLTADEGAVLSSYTIYRDATQSGILDVGVMSGATAYVTVSEGQFLKISGATMAPV